MVTLLDEPFKEAATLVEFTWGRISAPRSNAMRYVDWEEDVWDAKGERYSATPALEVEVPAMTVGLDPEEATIKVPLVLGSFADRISDGYPHAPVKVRIMELITAPRPQFPAQGVNVESRTPQINYLFSGVVTEGIRNPSGRSNLVQIKASSAKIGLQRKALGLQSNTQCDWVFGANGCHVDFDDNTKPAFPYIVTSSILNVNGNLVLVLDAGNVIRNKAFPFFWLDGYIDVDGLRLKILTWQQVAGGIPGFVLRDPAPPDWTGKVCDVVAGCDQSVGRCRFWGAEFNFSGFMASSPNFNPLFETPK